MKKSELKTIVAELIKEINYTQDSSGKSIIAQGSPGSVVRFTTEHPDIIKQMRDWAKDCQWGDVAFKKVLKHPFILSESRNLQS